LPPYPAGSARTQSKHAPVDPEVAAPVRRDIASKTCFMRFSINVKLQRPIEEFLPVSNWWLEHPIIISAINKG
jgi:hypothetical protein